mgnify:CR=1 FL=1
MHQQQPSSIATLSLEEVDQVSGAAGPLGSLIGGVLHGANVLINQVLNTPLVSSVGQTFNQFGPIGTGIHQAADTAGYAVFRGLEGLATAIGGPQGSVPYHFNTEWS